MTDNAIGIELSGSRLDVFHPEARVTERLRVEEPACA